MKVFHASQPPPVPGYAQRLQSLYTAQDVDTFKQSHQIVSKDKPSTVQSHQTIFSSPGPIPHKAHPLNTNSNSVFTSETEKPRKYNSSNQPASDPFGAQIHSQKTNNYLKSDLFSAEIPPPKQKVYKNAQTTEQQPYHRVLAAPRDLNNRAGITTDMQIREIVKKLIPQKPGQEQQLIYGKKRNENVQTLEKQVTQPKINIDFQKSDLWNGECVPKQTVHHQPRQSALDFGIEKIEAIKKPSISNQSNYETILHNFPITKFDCKNPNSLDGRKLFFNQNDAQNARRAACEEMMRNKTRMQ
ncbi:hypothetical protein SS50377_26421 [Spironucleus salmonicida]|uniref:Uncharacterized protein n=1 Tax=Spironucleus salmonicida TaxID=348837 RepID=V6LSU5_9EUKA|nr:hypothetical protein SS50377_28809 [Spironucleus salmonicida]KAH0572212.1 hypothetical protein SS50377_26421 [Spironucleus salmonicida]|eukprot:EST47712.1 hypothetical protein SS50377_12108 [Spironucleus salmonicida]